MTQEINATLTVWHEGGLNAALVAALGSKCHGMSTYGPGRDISIWLDDTAVQADKDSAAALAAAHDPCFITVDKTSIIGDGIDVATVTVRAPKPNAAAVVLLVNNTPIPVNMNLGTGTIQIASSDPAVVTVTLQNPQNRTTDSLTIEAV